MLNKYCIANWKMNFSHSQAENFLFNLKEKHLNNNVTKIILCPSFVSLFSIINTSKDLLIDIGAQNVFYESIGAYTGEVSSTILNEIGVKYVIVGHSERRNILKETDEMINYKMRETIKNNLIPILCVGESLIDRDNGNVEKILRHQIKSALKEVEGNFILAYEPLWAIGTGRSADKKIIYDTHRSIRNILNEYYSNRITPLIYGGSVSPENAGELSNIDNVDGFLIGGASQDVEKFYKIYQTL